MSAGVPLPVRRCAVCGCTDEASCAGGCLWVDDELCSRCDEETLDGDQPCVYCDSYDCTRMGEGAALVQAIGAGVELRSNGDSRRQKAVLRSITFKAGKDGKPGTTTLKVTGAAELDDAIGSAVKVKPMQMNLPG